MAFSVGAKPYRSGLGRKPATEAWHFRWVQNRRLGRSELAQATEAWHFRWVQNDDGVPEFIGGATEAWHFRWVQNLRDTSDAAVWATEAWHFRWVQNGHGIGGGIRGATEAWHFRWVQNRYSCFAGEVGCSSPFIRRKSIERTAGTQVFGRFFRKAGCRPRRVLRCLHGAAAGSRVKVSGRCGRPLSPAHCTKPGAATPGEARGIDDAGLQRNPAGRRSG